MTKVEKLALVEAFQKSPADFLDLARHTRSPHRDVAQVLNAAAFFSREANISRWTAPSVARYLNLLALGDAVIRTELHFWRVASRPLVGGR